jgi:hypothetical protein
MMRTLVLSFALTASASQGGTIILEEAKKLSAINLARRVLPAPTATKIVGGGLRRRWLPGQVYGASFWEAPTAIGPMICRRRAHGVELANRSAPGGEPPLNTVLQVGEVESGDTFAPSYPARATSRSCASRRGYIAPARGREAATLAVLERLSDAMRLANGRAPLPFKITCREDGGNTACRDPRAALAGLPLDALFAIQFIATQYQTTSVVPGKAGGPSIWLRKAVPGARTIPVAAFGSSGTDGRSWRISFIDAPGAPSEIRMERMQIAYD